MRFALAALATWRVTHLLAREDGPGGVVARAREAIGSRPLGELMDCFGCLSIWVAAGFTPSNPDQINNAAPMPLGTPPGSTNRLLQMLFVHGDVRDEQRPLVTSSAKFLNKHLHEVPVMMIPCLQGRPDGEPAGKSASFWGSLLPAAWSFMLALRSRGLGSAWFRFRFPSCGRGGGAGRRSRSR